MIKIIQNRKTWYTASSIAIVISLGIIGFMGMRLGIDFTGGSLLEVSYTQERPEASDVNDVIKSFSIASVQIQAVGELGYLVRMPDIKEETRRDIVASLKEQIGDTGGISVVSDSPNNLVGIEDVGFTLDSAEDGDEASNHLIEQRFEAIGPAIGQELKSKSLEAIVVVLVAILLYIAWAFRKVSWPVKSWKYGIVALITLFHDVVIVLGVFTLFTHIFAWELNTAFVAAILTIVGYSVNDTIVVFDRIRENLPRVSGHFEDVVNLSVNQTVSRSINTSITTLLVLVAIIIFGGSSIRSFVAALSMGVVVGTYSSIFIASPLLVTAQLLKKNKK